MFRFLAHKWHIAPSIHQSISFSYFSFTIPWKWVLCILQIYPRYITSFFILLKLYLITIPLSPQEVQTCPSGLSIYNLPLLCLISILWPSGQANGFPLVLIDCAICSNYTTQLTTFEHVQLCSLLLFMSYLANSSGIPMRAKTAVYTWTPWCSGYWETDRSF